MPTRDISELARTYHNIVTEAAAAHMPALVPLEVFDATMHQQAGWVLCYFADRVVRCIVDPLYDLSSAVNSTNYVLWALPAKGSDNGGEYVAIAHALNGPAGTRAPAIRATSFTIVDSGGTTTPVSTVTDHGGLTGLTDDDHSQYHNDSRGDARYVQLSLFDAHTIIAATSDNTPAALTVTEQTVVGRVTGGNIAATAIDSDLSTVSGSHDTVPSAKAAKDYADSVAGTDADAIHDNVNGEINAITEKASPADADVILIEDSAASYAKKYVQIGNLPGGAGDTTLGWLGMFI